MRERVKLEFVKKDPGHYSAIHNDVEYRVVRTCRGNYVAHTFTPPSNHYGTPRGWFRSAKNAMEQLQRVAEAAKRTPQKGARREARVLQLEGGDKGLPKGKMVTLVMEPGGRRTKVKP
jgi:hypothetical protein